MKIRVSAARSSPLLGVSRRLHHEYAERIRFHQRNQTSFGRQLQHVSLRLNLPVKSNRILTVQDFSSLSKELSAQVNQSRNLTMEMDLQICSELAAQVDRSKRIRELKACLEGGLPMIIHRSLRGGLDALFARDSEKIDERPILIRTEFKGPKWVNINAVFNFPAWLHEMHDRKVRKRLINSDGWRWGIMLDYAECFSICIAIAGRKYETRMSDDVNGSTKVEQFES